MVDDEFDEDPTFAVYKDILNKFGVSGEDEVTKEANAGNTGELFLSDDDIPDEEGQGPQRISKKKRKQLTKLSVAELKALVNVPEVVEWQDTSSSDPRLLVQIKAQKNVVPVPTHWSLKREYLSSKRGIEKPPFRLPKFIADTGISEMRDAVLEKQAEQTLKQKQRERVSGKTGKLDIDYGKLYDAFFKFQEKPDLTRFGEVYYEGKETEVDYAHFRPGELSTETKEALGMPPGAPPPWLINQQRWGAPPSYPTLRIPGLNAPLPSGGSWGYQPGGWGKPPVDDFNRPLFGGDVFGVSNGQGAAQSQQQQQEATELVHKGEPVEKEHWGQLINRVEEEEEEEDDSDEDSDDEEEDEDDELDPDAPPGHDMSGLETPGGYSTSAHPDGGMETAIEGELDLRKGAARRGGFDTEESSAPRSAYTVLPERQVRAEGFFGSDRVYDLSQSRGGGDNLRVLGAEDESRKRKKPGDVEASLDLDALQSNDGVDKDEVKRRFEQGRREEGPGSKWNNDDDLSNMIAEESRKRQKMDKENRDRKGKK